MKNLKKLKKKRKINQKLMKINFKETCRLKNSTYMKEVLKI